MENLEVRAKSFTIKWVNAPASSRIKWEMKPLKRSINLGIYRQNKPAADILQPPSIPLAAPSSAGSPNFTSSVPNSASSITTVDNYSLDEVNQVPKKLFGVYKQQTLKESSDSVNSPQATSNNNSSSALVNSPNETKNGQLPSLTPPSRNRSGSVSSGKSNGNLGASSLEEKLDRYLVREQWIGKCEGDELITDTFDVKVEGLYAFVFDNTFSKHKAKKIMFNQYIEEEDRDSNSVQASPNSAQGPTLMRNSDSQLHTIDEDSNSNLETTKITSLNLQQQTLANPTQQRSQPSLQCETSNLRRSITAKSHVKFELPEDTDALKTATIIRVKGGQYLQGFLLKKKRRKSGGKNFTKRFFILNVKYGALDYFLNDKTNNIRGNMPIRQAIISADPKQRMFYLDSGVEQWILKALNKDDFDVWIQAFNFIKKQNRDIPQAILRADPEFSSQTDYEDALEHPVDGRGSPVPLASESATPLTPLSPIDDRIGRSNVFRLVEAKIDSIKGLAINALEASKQQHSLAPPKRTPNLERRSSFFWKKNRNTNHKEKEKEKEKENEHRDGSTTATPSQSAESVTTANGKHLDLPSSGQASTSSESQSLQPIPLLEDLLAEIKELESQYQVLKNTAANRGLSTCGSVRSSSRRALALSRTNTIATTASQEFFDANDYIEETRQGVILVADEDDDGIVKDVPHPEKSDETRSLYEGQDTQLFEKQLTSTILSGASSDDESDQEQEKAELRSIASSHIPASDMYPLTYNKQVKYRTDIKPSVVNPPSLVGILRRAIGKDLSSIPMPVASNEPLSFLQKYSEAFEYVDLLNNAFESPIENGERILKIAAFAVSTVSPQRVKQRSARKPFNPLLGETYELARPDLGLRLIGEKVVHRPVIFAIRAQTEKWVADHNFSPQNKFFGKSLEISLTGKLKLKAASGEAYEWDQPTTVVKNVIGFGGERYAEPGSSVSIKCSNGYKAVINFIPAPSGRFSGGGRSEDVVITVFDGKGKQLPKSVVGKWTESLKFKDTNEVIWEVGKLVPDYEKKFGFTEFAASLNDMTEIDKDCAPTDSRRRPDQRLYENGEVDPADDLKLVLEQHQRDRRKDKNGNPTVHTPVFFKKVGDDDYDWEFIDGKMSYWERRRVGDWKGLLKLW